MDSEISQRDKSEKCKVNKVNQQTWLLPVLSWIIISILKWKYNLWKWNSSGKIDGFWDYLTFSYCTLGIDAWLMVHTKFHIIPRNFILFQIFGARLHNGYWMIMKDTLYLNYYYFIGIITLNQTHICAKEPIKTFNLESWQS